MGLEPRSLYLVSAAAGRTSLPDGILGLTDSLQGSSVEIGTIQRRLAWPLRKDDTHKSGSVLNSCATFATRGCWQQLAAPKNLAEAAGGEGNKELCFNGPDRVCLILEAGLEPAISSLGGEAPYPLGHANI